jgi:SulP family sulfate permease
MLHSLFLLLFMLLAAPLAALIPLASLAGVLAVVAWNMAEKQQFWVLLRSSWGDALVVMATFLLTVFRDLTEGIVVGFALGAVLFINRMAKSTGIEEIASPDIADDANGSRGSYDVELATDPDIVVYRIRGAFFFGAASTVGTVLDRISPTHKTFIFEFDHVPFIDSTAANTIAGVARRAERHHVQLYITGASPAVRRELLTHGVKSHAEFRTSIAEAAQEAREKRRVIGRTV